jgi:hypothetical protein
LIASPSLSDNVVAILTLLGRQADAVKRIRRRIAEGPADQQEEALTELSILAGLRRLNSEIRREAEKMPIREDIMKSPFVERYVRHGVTLGQREVLVAMLEKRFGSVSPATRGRLEQLNPAQLRAASLRLLDAARVEDLFD